MPQNWANIFASTKLQDSLQPILDRDVATRSSHSGTAFPTSNLEIGMLCWRTDEARLYILSATTPSNTWRVVVDQAYGDTRYQQASGGSTSSGTITVANTSPRFALNDSDGATSNRYVDFHLNGGVMSLRAMSDDGSTALRTLLTGATATGAVNVPGSLTVNSNTVYHAGNMGPASGLNADLLDGQHGTYYLSYTNLTNRPTLGTASAINTGDIQSYVDLSSRVAKAGDTMTGALTVQGDITASSGSLRSHIAANPATGQVALGNGSARLFWSGASFDLNGALAVGGNITNSGNQVLHLGMNGNTVGSYVWAAPNLSSSIGVFQLNSTIAGSNLSNGAQTLGGTWRCMGRSVPTEGFQSDGGDGGGGTSFFTGYSYTIWQRIA